MIGTPRDPALRDAVAKLRAWLQDGGQRRDANRDGVYEHSDAIRILDAWWPLWVKAQFEPALGAERLQHADRHRRRSTTRPTATASTTAPPTRARSTATSPRTCARVLGERVKGPYSRRYCGIAQALPHGAAELARGRAEGPEPLHRRRALQGRRPVVLRRGPPAPDRRRHPAADPLDQPPDLPAGRRDPEAPAALSAAANVAAAMPVATRGPIAIAGPATAAPSA